MTRLGHRLEVFDRLGPEPGVYERARRGPSRDVPPDRDGAKRVAAAVTAIAVFLAAAVFAWSAFDGSEPPPPEVPAVDVVPLGDEGSILWPDRSEDTLAARQADADAGARDRFLLDPERTVEVFAETVLGWYPRDSYEMTIAGDAGNLLATLTRIPDNCIVDEDRGFQPCFAATEEITLVQPVRTGEGGIWAIAGVRSPALELGVATGEIVTNGGAVEANGENRRWPARRRRVRSSATGEEA